VNDGIIMTASEKAYNAGDSVCVLLLNYLRLERQRMITRHLHGVFFILFWI
jgi:hypothetical protein